MKGRPYNIHNTAAAHDCAKAQIDNERLNFLSLPYDCIWLPCPYQHIMSNVHTK